MNKNLSSYLDITRGLTALCVVFHHYNDDIVKLTWNVFPRVGQEAVMMFFLLSGFLIAWVAHEKEKTFKDFAIKRLSRLWSVLLPSILVVIACNYAALNISHSQLLGERLDVSGVVSRSLAAVTFANWNVFTDGYYLNWARVMWSLTCEFWYYLLFAVGFYYDRRAWVVGLCLVICVFIGPGPILLMPVWLAGAWVWKKSRDLKWPVGYACLTSICAIILMGLLWRSGIRNFVFNHTPSHILGEPLVFGREALYFYLFAILGALFLLSLCSVAKTNRELPKWVHALFKRLAGTSFFLYLTHYALMNFFNESFKAMGIEPVIYLIPLLAIAVALTFGHWVEGTKSIWAVLLNKISPAVLPNKQEIHQN